jgi:hypothetical protein
MAVMPIGSHVVARHDALNAIGANSRTPNINFEEIHFHEDENKVSGRVNGLEFEQDVESVNRNTTRRATWGKTPGGARDRR